MARDLTPKKIKSAQRVLEVLEYFTGRREEATVMDIARAMGYPQSSTSELLGCLVDLGYLHRDMRARTYRPSARVALIGAWVQPDFFRRGLLSMMDVLAAEVGTPVVLANRVGLEVQYIHTVAPFEQDQTGGVVSIKTHLLHSTPGRALLSTSGTDSVRKLVHRLNAEACPELRVSADTLLTELREIRAQGYACGRHQGGDNLIAVLLPQSRPEEQLALSISAPSADRGERTEDYVRKLRAAIAREFGPVAVTSQPEPLRFAEPTRRFA